MGSRGRGGRGAGGGRGRGMSFNVEALGFGIGESLPSPVLTPPSLFPPLPNPPVSLRAEDKRNTSFSGSVDWDYCVMVKKSLVDWLWDVSPFSTIIGGPNDGAGKAAATTANVGAVERYSDRYLVPGDKDLCCFDWKRLPKELRPGSGVGAKPVKRAAGEATKEGVKRKKVLRGTGAGGGKGDLEKRLAELERREGEEDGEEGEVTGEGSQGGGEGEEGGAEGKEREGRGEGGEEEEEELEEEDEEMDDGTDYISSYFDNGEGYLDDDDDNGDDGPTY